MKVIGNIFCISNHPKLNRLYYALKNWREILLGFFEGVSFCVSQIKHRNNTNYVLMVEAQPWHGEILPGYVKYFQDLGYQVDLMVRYKNYKDSPFIKMAKPPKSYCLPIGLMLFFLRSNLIRNYRYIFLTSDFMSLKELSFVGRFSELVGSEFSQSNNVYWVEHDIEKALSENIKTNNNYDPHYFSHVFSLTSTKYFDATVLMLNPNYFGDFEIVHDFTEKIYLIVGRLSSQIRDFTPFCKMIKKLTNYYKFKILVMGPAHDKSLLDCFPDNMRFIGYLKFKEFYEVLFKATFLLPLLSKEVPSQQHYLTSCTSGSRQLSLGFELPMIIQKDFGLHYGFDKRTAFFYNDDEDMEEAFIRSLELSQKDYALMCENLKGEALCVRKTSLDNLSQCIKNVK